MAPVPSPALGHGGAPDPGGDSTGGGEARRPWSSLPLVLAVGCALSYAVVLVLPYYVNDLDRYPLAEVASGAHDPKDLWPYTHWYGSFFALGGLATVGFGPLFAGGALVWALFDLWVLRRDRDVAGKVLVILAVVVTVGTLVWLRTSFASALVAWWLD
jgi:hypothetical protein